MAEFRLDRARALKALQATAVRVAALIGSITDPGAPTTGLEWTLGQTAAHVVADVRMHRRWLAGDGLVDYGIPDLAGRNVENLTALGEHSPSELAEMLRTETAAYASEAAVMPAGTTISAEVGPALTIEEITAVLLGELVVHGFDLAGSLGRPWEIGRAEANIVAAGALATLPQFVNPGTAAHADDVFDIRLRQGPRARVTVSKGRMTVEPNGSGPVDVHISADAAAFLLVGYGRVGQWGPILRGKLLAWGRRPLAAFRFASYLRNP
jgi:uncharacterized protein (TIGR03083 family)